MIAGLLPGALLLVVAVAGQGGASAAEPATERAEDTAVPDPARVPAAARGVGDPATLPTRDWLAAQDRALLLLEGGAQPPGGFRTLALADLPADSGPDPRQPDQPRGDTTPKLGQAVRREQFGLEDPDAADPAAGGPVRLRSGTRVHDTGRWERADGASGLGAFRLHDDTWMFPDAASDRIVGHIQELGRNERSWPVVWRGLHWERPDGTTGRAYLLPDETVLFTDGRWERPDGGAGEGAAVLEDKTVVFPDGRFVDPYGNPFEGALWLPASGTWVLPLGYWARVAGGSGFGAFRLPSDTVAFRRGDAWWWERADGSSGDGLPPGSVTLPSGTLVLPGGLWREPGGKLGQGATILASGTVVFDRSGRWERPDSSAGPRAVVLHDTTWVFSDGHWEGPQGSGEGATIRDDGTVVIPNNRIEYADKTVAWADGRVDLGVVHRFEDGSELLVDDSRRFPDGRRRLLDGSIVDKDDNWTFPNGDMRLANGWYWHARDRVWEYRPDPPYDPEPAEDRQGSLEPPASGDGTPLAVAPGEPAAQWPSPLAVGVAATPPAAEGRAAAPSPPEDVEGLTPARPGTPPQPSPQEREPAAPDHDAGAAAGSGGPARGVADEVAGGEVGEVGIAGGGVAGGGAGTSAERGSGGGEGTDPAPSGLDLDGTLVVGSGAGVAGFA